MLVILFKLALTLAIFAGIGLIVDCILYPGKRGPAVLMWFNISCILTTIALMVVIVIGLIWFGVSPL